MTTDVDICNLALGHLGQQGKVTSLVPPDGWAHSAKCATFFPMARKKMLEDRAWTFAGKRVALAAVTPTVESGQFPYAFALPSDLVRARAVIPVGATDEDSNAIPFHVEAGVLFTTIEEPILKYTYLNVDPNSYSAGGCEALSWLMAGYLAGFITDDKMIKTWCMEQYAASLSAATSSNMTSDQRQSNYTPAGVAAR